MQATLVTGFAFTSFSADALQVLDYSNSPARSFAFIVCGAATMALSISSVGVASYLTGAAERLAMETSVRRASSICRYRMKWITNAYGLSLICLFFSAALLVLGARGVGGGHRRTRCQWNDELTSACCLRARARVCVCVRARARQSRATTRISDRCLPRRHLRRRCRRMHLRR